ncbi:MAG: gliding motility-associated C-terminal domain-containing protein [Bacteroidota bacterium]
MVLIVNKIIGKIAILIIVFVAFNLSSFKLAKANMICDISIDTPMPVCPGIYFELSVFEEPNQTFNWQKKIDGDFVTVGNESVLGTSVTDTSVFRVIVIDTIAIDTCQSDEFVVTTYPQIFIEFNQLQLTCTNGDNENGNTASIRAIATGELQTDEYQYFWDVPPIHIAQNDPALVYSLKGHQYYTITVRDNFNCPKKDTVWTETYDNPEIEINADPDTAFIQKPYITYSYINLSEDSISISNHFWWFSDSIPDPDYENTSDLPDPTYTYEKVGQYYVILTVYNPQGCDTTYTKNVEVKPVELFIPNVFTPGGDGANDTFMITNDTENESERVRKDALNKFYESSHLVVFNRMGRTVFEADNYDGMWDGDNLEDGVYYYVLECHGKVSTDVFKGPITIVRPR